MKSELIDVCLASVSTGQEQRLFRILATGIFVQAMSIRVERRNINLPPSFFFCSGPSFTEPECGNLLDYTGVLRN